MPSLERRAFATRETVPPTVRERDHGGAGIISFRRMFDACDFASPIDFVDVTVIPPGSTIGRHTHSGNEEIYFIISGEPRVVVADQERRLAACGVAVVRSAEAHQLINDTDHDVIIGVVQVRISP